MKKLIKEINGNKIFLENGEVKTVLREDIQENGFMTIEEARNLTLAELSIFIKTVDKQ